MAKTVTIKDIAEKLGVSTSTVSRALTDKWDINPDTREKILAAAIEMNYHPNMLSLGLRNKQTFSIGVIVPELKNSFFAEVIEGINSVLIEQNYQILICQSSESYEKELNNVKFLESRYVDGYLVSTAHDSKNSIYYQSLINRGVPVVFFNRTCRDVIAPKVIVDDRKWAFTATEHLIKQGCRRIAHLEGPENLSVSIMRKQGYIDALVANGISIDESLIIPSGIFIEDGICAAEMIMSLPNLPDGMFAVTDPVAVGAMKYLTSKGIRIPKDIAVVGFSESPMARIVEPNLTSVVQPTFEIGASSARLIMEWLHNGKMPARSTIILDAKLNVRSSSMLI